MNKVILMGRLVKEPELSQTPSGVSVLRFALAVNRKYKNDEGNYDADFISCIAWRGTAEFISKYFVKGNKIGIVGNIVTGSYEKDGTKHYTTDVNVDECYFVESKNEAVQAASAPETSSDPFDGFVVDADADTLPWE